MFTKTKMPEICMTYCKHRDEFKAIKEDPNLMRVMASWEKKCGIYREPEESSAKKRARLGPAPNEMNAPAKSECKQHVSNFFPTSLTCHQCKQENSPKSVYLSCRTILLCSGPCQLCSHCMIQNQICPHCVMKLTPPIPFKLQRFRLDWKSCIVHSLIPPIHAGWNKIQTVKSFDFDSISNILIVFAPKMCIFLYSFFRFHISSVHWSMQTYSLSHTYLQLQCFVLPFWKQAQMTSTFPWCLDVVILWHWKNINPHNVITSTHEALYSLLTSSIDVLSQGFVSSVNVTDRKSVV